MGHSSWWPVNLRRLHHGHLVNNKPQLQAPIKGSGSVSIIIIIIIIINIIITITKFPYLLAIGSPNYSIDKTVL